MEIIYIKQCLNSHIFKILFKLLKYLNCQLETHGSINFIMISDHCKQEQNLIYQSPLKQLGTNYCPFHIYNFKNSCIFIFERQILSFEFRYFVIYQLPGFSSKCDDTKMIGKNDTKILLFSSPLKFISLPYSFHYLI